MDKFLGLDENGEAITRPLTPAEYTALANAINDSNAA